MCFFLPSYQIDYLVPNCNTVNNEECERLHCKPRFGSEADNQSDYQH